MTIKHRSTSYAPAFRGANGRFRSTMSIIREQQTRRNRLRLGQAIDDLKAIDPEGWEAWFDDDNNVPSNSTYTHHAEIIEARVAQLRADKDELEDDLEFPYGEFGRPLPDDESGFLTGAYEISQAEINERMTERQELKDDLAAAEQVYGEACVAYHLDPSDENARAREDARKVWTAARNVFAGDEPPWMEN